MARDLRSARRMTDPDTTLRMDAPPSFAPASQLPLPSQRPTILGVSPPPTDVAALAFDAIPTKPTLLLELAYYQNLAARPPCDEEPMSHEALPWHVEVEVEAPISAEAWARRFEPVSVRPPAPVARPRRHWPWFVAAAISGGLLGAASYLGLHLLAGGAL